MITIQKTMLRKGEPGPAIPNFSCCLPLAYTANARTPVMMMIPIPCAVGITSQPHHTNIAAKIGRRIAQNSPLRWAADAAISASIPSEIHVYR